MLHGNVHLHPFVLTICPFYGHLLFTNFKLYFGLMQIHACYAYLRKKSFLTEFFLIMMLKRLVSPSSFLQVQLPISILTFVAYLSIAYICAWLIVQIPVFLIHFIYAFTSIHHYFFKTLLAICFNFVPDSIQLS